MHYVDEIYVSEVRDPESSRGTNTSTRLPLVMTTRPSYMERQRYE